MPRIALFVIVLTLALTSARADDIRVLVSNVAGARDYDPVVGSGYVVLPAPHVDLNVIWDAATQTFSGGFRTDASFSGGGAGVQFGPENAIAYLSSTGRRQRTNPNPQYDFQGAIDETFWLFPANGTVSNNNLTLYLGFSAYGVPRDGTFTNNRIRWTVHSVENLTQPEATAFYGYFVSVGTPTVQLTHDPAYAGAEMEMIANGHLHRELLFQAPGMYRVTFRISATLAATGQEVSSLLPAYYGIEEWEIPPATAPAIALNGDLAFGNVTVGQTSTRTLTISNTGNAPLNVGSINYPTGFSGNWNSGSIAAGSSQNLNVTFTPAAAQSYSGNITVNSDATSGTNTISASGTGTPSPTRVIALSGNLAFGNVTVGQTSTRTLTISNTGNAPLNVGSINYPTGFSGNWNSGSIAAGSSQNVNVTFTPAAALSYSGNITINSDATSGTSTMSASGTGRPPALRILSHGQPVFDGTQTAITLRLQSTPQTLLHILFTGSLATDPVVWLSNGAPHLSGPTGEFDATFHAPGNHTDQWSRHMFFRLSY